MRKTHSLIFVLLVLIVLIAPIKMAWSQLPGIEIVELTITPEQPGPNQTVVAKLSSFATRLETAEITWVLNGKTISSGQGEKTISFKTGPLGSKTSLQITGITSEGYPISKSLTLFPASVDILVESETFTPPFYRGRAYFSYQGDARVIAVPSFTDENGQQMASKSLIFTWRVGDKIMQNYSGVGKNVFYYKGGTIIRPDSISVDVSTLNQKMVAKTKIEITPTEPKVVLYEEDPEYGTLYNKALEKPITLNKEEIKISAIPYFFSTDKANGKNLKYNWSLNGESAGKDVDFIILKKPSDSSGHAILNLQLSNTKDIFQFSESSLNITFGNVNKNLFR